MGRGDVVFQLYGMKVIEKFEPTMTIAIPNIMRAWGNMSISHRGVVMGSPHHM